MCCCCYAISFDEPLAENDMTKTYDAVVVGAGYIGCAAGYHLAAAGLRTVLLDKGDVGSGASLNNYGNIQIQDAELHNCLPIAVVGAQRIKTLATHLGQPTGFRRLGSLLMIESESQWKTMQARLPKLQAAGLAVEMLPASRLPEIEPLLNHANFIGASYHPNEGQIDPSSMMQAYVKAGIACGLALHVETEVTGFDLVGGNIQTVRTNRGDYSTAVVILCAGAWTAKLGLQIGQKWALQHIQDLALTTAVSEFRLRNHITSAAFFQEVGNDQSNPVLAVSQTAENNFLLGEVGSVLTDCYETAIPDCQAEITAMIERHLPKLKGIPIIRNWSAPVAFTADGLPYFGRVTNIPNLIVAAAFRSTAVSSPVVGEMIADLALNGRTWMDLNPFSPDRNL